MKRFALLMLCLLCATIAYAQDPDALDTVEEKKEGVNVSLTVNYGSAYREHSWVPVDILVSNYEYDISGHVEVRSFDMSGEIQSPIYRLPAECPENSRKRYRLYCHMDGAAGLEARLYHKNRVINQASANIQVRAIEPQDFLCLVLDNITEDYGFLGTELFKANTNVRLHRETLTTARLGLLADYPQCYSSFDIIIMGDVDPNRIAESHRDLLRSYVEQGGVLAVCTGGQAENYRGSWLEDLLGVQIGPETFTSETAIAQAAFPPVQQAGAVADRNCALATLTPVAEGVQTLGDSLVLATLRRYGSGYAATIAVDTKSKALQHCAGYQQLWRDLCDRRSPQMEVNLDAAAQLGRETLIGMAGVELLPKSTVVTYLLLYFLVGIVANWIFWALMKRREMAWVCLIFFSFGFTAYAVVFGTAGRAQRTEIERIDILRLPDNASVARLDALAGVLTAGTGQYAGSLSAEHALIRDILPGSEDFMMNQRGLQALARRPPFVFTQTDPARFDELQIGASDMRLLHISTETALAGPIEGTVRKQDGQVRGSFHNGTGLDLRTAALLHDGTLYPIEIAGEQLTVDRPYQPNQGVRGSSMQIGSNQNAQMRGYQEQFLINLLQETDATNAQMRAPILSASYFLESVSPCIVAWLDTPPQAVLAVQGNPTQHLESVLLLARIENAETGDYRPARYLPCQIDVESAEFGGYPGMAQSGTTIHFPFQTAPEDQQMERWMNQSRLIDRTSPLRAQVALPREFMRRKDRHLWLEVFSEPNPAYTIRVNIVQGAADLAPATTGQFTLGNQRLVRHLYDLMPWVNDQSDWQQDLQLSVFLLPNPDGARVYGAQAEQRDHTRVAVSFMLEETGISEGATIAWK